MKKNYFLSACMLILSMSSALAQTDTINIDFGAPSDTTNPPWNNLTDYLAGSLSNLTNAKGVSTAISIAVTDSFSSVNGGGTTADPTLPANATSDHFFGNTVAAFGLHQPTAGFTLSGLDPAVAYNFGFFASRMGPGSDNREAQYTVTGTNKDSAAADATVANPTMVWANNVMPKPDGTITIHVTAGPNNTSSVGYYYLSLMSIVYPPGGAVGLNEQSLSNLRIYPNPATDRIHVSLEADAKIKNVAVHSATGSRIMEIAGSHGNKQTIDIGNIPKGIYFLKVEYGNGVQTSKIIVE